MENLFENILDQDEKIIKVFKPNKFKYFFTSVFASILGFLFFSGMGLAAMLVPDENGDTASLAAFIVIVVICALLVAFCILVTALSYSKRYYAYSNKRIIIRCGVVGIDYKSLDMDMIGAINVNVSLFDKMLRKNTGTISFGSVASPMSANGAYFSFYSVVSPYELYKEIKLIINEKKVEFAKPVEAIAQEAKVEETKSARKTTTKPKVQKQKTEKEEKPE